MKPALIFLISLIFYGASAQSKNEISLYFDHDQSSLNSTALATLMNIFSKSNSTNISSIIIDGYTDSVGSKSYNYSLSEKRVNSVKSYLLLNGISETKIQVNFFGEDKVLVNNPNNENRKVVININYVQNNTYKIAKEQISNNEFQVLEINPTQDNTIVGNKGIILKIPEFSFVNLDGQPVYTKVKIKLLEVLENLK